MNKRNFWFSLIVAAVMIVVAAAAGAIYRMVKVNSAKVEINSSRDNYGKKKVSRRTISVIRGSKASEPEVVVKFKPDVSLKDIQRIVTKNNDRIEDEIELVKNQIWIDDLDDATPAEVAKQYSLMTDLVLYAEPNAQIKLAPSKSRAVTPKKLEKPVGAPNDPMFEEQWALSNTGQEGGTSKADISAVKAWLKTQGSEDVVVAVLDTGVDYTHTDLVRNIWVRPDNIPAYNDDELGPIDDKRGYNADANNGDPMDDNGHGTHCAGIIGAEGNNNEGISGVNWKVEIMPLKFLGRGGFGSTKNAIEAINYAVDRKKAGVNIRVINASWGSTQYSKALEDAIRAAGENGILFIAAAGNSSTDNDRRPHYPSNYDLPNVISVAATDRNDVMASFSNYGAKTVHIAAPGKDIVSTWINGGFREASGTSMATPQVAGVAALIVSGNEGIGVEDLRSKLLEASDPVDSLNGKVENGGRINAAKALD